VAGTSLPGSGLCRCNLDWRPHNPGQNIEARQSLSARAVRTGSLGHTCKGEASRWEGHGLKPWIEAAKRRLHRNVLA
jgi:hypothetical protein